MGAELVIELKKLRISSRVVVVGLALGLSACANMILSSERSAAASSAQAAGLQSGRPLPADTVRPSAPPSEERWVRWEV
jgi:hypothetical protein